MEFLVTYRCTSRCEHCHVLTDDADAKIKHMDLGIARKAIKDAYDLFKIKTLMTFGGEPLLFPEFTCELHKYATELGIEKRQIITNGYFSNKIERIKQVVKLIKESGVNSIYISVDCFHEKHLDYKTVEKFLYELKKADIPIVRLHPAWVVNKQHENKYNYKTKETSRAFQSTHMEMFSLAK